MIAKLLLEILHTPTRRKLDTYATPIPTFLSTVAAVLTYRSNQKQKSYPKRRDLVTTPSAVEFQNPSRRRETLAKPTLLA
ncbi:Hypothetical predicted protein [Prunus dulcis]|uniref:Uncharacterized protein n=1 Tax=Prunus dulcis TaxID=3755 RepID=A0A5E4FZU6_PRUDU|nr:Hypothetical predicted protein [Prunus dulcis]